ncbi:MAG: hypothetical protein AVDCRST_MAG22-1487 [uncultured Rubrobacteraceae bacterium]|uniref:Uncharacterized protein n=1 Tax=uncultured Rubrobacteraceae bacterium TaxID=349277 RepID=A0A6J4P3C0_9ACTN|nr:MAG: hypothetical protein AVDCRST_MAG22-1487 [uncultured Rubrobacteraceae bacterium]
MVKRSPAAVDPLRLLWLGCFPAEAAAGWLLLASAPWKAVLALALHALAVAVFGLSLLIRAAGYRNWSWSLLGGALSFLIFPLFGMAVTAGAFALARSVLWRPGRAVAAIEDSVDLQGPEGDVVSRARRVEISLLDEREVEPVVDVLQEDDPEAKRAAIAALTKRRDGGTVRLLTGLLHDPSPEARFFASLALSKLEDEIGKQILAAQRDLAENPQSPESRERLAEAYLEYTLSGFLEGTTRDYYLELARQAFEDALEVSPHTDRLTLRLARVHLMLGNIAQAAAILDDLARRKPNDATVHQIRMEVIYQFGDFRELSVYARRVLARVPEGSEARELVEWWAEAGREEASGVV